MTFPNITNISDLSNIMASGRLPVDPAQCFRETLNDFSGTEEVSDGELRIDYAEKMAERIGRYLSLANVQDMDMDVFYNGAVEAMRPVKLTLGENDEQSVWLSVAVDIPALIEKSCINAQEEQKEEIRRNLLQTAATGRSFESEIEGVSVRGETIPKVEGKRKFHKAVQKVFAGAMLATYLFLVPQMSFAQTTGISDTSVSAQQEQTVQSKRVLNTLTMFQTKKYTEQQKKLSPDIHDEYINSESVSKKLDALKDKPLSEKLNAVNDMWNKIPYMSDKKNYGEEDHWATPAETQAKNAADCEDYAIGKYFSLRKAGVSASDMRIIVGYTSDNEVHAVLAVWGKDNKGNDQCFILDNMHQKVQTEQSMVGKFLPKISLNENFAWNHVTSKEYAQTAEKIFPAAYAKKNVNKNIAAKKKINPPSFAENSALSNYQEMRM